MIKKLIFFIFYLSIANSIIYSQSNIANNRDQCIQNIKNKYANKLSDLKKKYYYHKDIHGTRSACQCNTGEDICVKHNSGCCCICENSIQSETEIIQKNESNESQLCWSNYEKAMQAESIKTKQKEDLEEKKRDLAKKKKEFQKQQDEIQNQRLKQLADTQEYIKSQNEILQKNIQNTQDNIQNTGNGFTQSIANNINTNNKLNDDIDKFGAQKSQTKDDFNASTKSSFGNIMKKLQPQKKVVASSTFIPFNNKILFEDEYVIVTYSTTIKNVVPCQYTETLNSYTDVDNNGVSHVKYNEREIPFTAYYLHGILEITFKKQNKMGLYGWFDCRPNQLIQHANPTTSGIKECFPDDFYSTWLDNFSYAWDNYFVGPLHYEGNFWTEQPNELPKLNIKFSK